MTRVSFYLHPASRLDEIHYTACLLAEKAYCRGLSAYLYCDTLAEAKKLNRLLWGYSENSFIPHSIYSPNVVSSVPLQIGYQGIVGCPEVSILINMSQTILSEYPKFRSVIELVSIDAKRRQAAREKYRQYQKENCILQSLEIGIAPELIT